MSVVGLTLGSGANAIRPSAASAASVATMASTLLDGCVRSYHAKPRPSTATSSVKVVSCQVMGVTARGAAAGAADHGGPSRSRAGRPPPRQQRGAGGGQQRAAAGDPRGLGGEVPAAGQHGGGGA